MSTIFKLNNRFSALSEDFSEKNVYYKKCNEIVHKDEKKYYKNNKNYKKELLMEEKNKNLNFSKENFPLLLPKEDILESKELTKPMNFIEKIKKLSIPLEKNNIHEDEEYKNLKPGWVLIKQDPINKKIIHLYKKNNDLYKNNFEKYIDNDLKNNENIVNKLIQLYEKRKDEYIQLWGYDDWEKEFRFPNYDYEYFDKLDELYEEELLEEELFYEEEFLN